MARKRGGGFGGQGSFANAGPGGGGGGGGGGNAFNQGPTAAPARGGGGGGGGGGGNNNPFNRQQQRQQQQRRRQRRRGGPGGGTTDPNDPNAPEDPNDPNTTDSQSAADAFQDIDNRRTAAKGYLGGAGIRFDSPVGANATNWLNNRIDTMAEDYQGQQFLTPDLTYNDYLNQILAGAAPAPPVYPTTPPTGNEDIMDTPVHAMGDQGKGKGKGKRRRKRLPMLPEQSPENPSAATTTPVVPVGVPTNPAEVRARLQRDFEAGSPLQTGRDSRLWRAPHRVIQF